MSKKESGPKVAIVSPGRKKITDSPEEKVVLHDQEPFNMMLKEPIDGLTEFKKPCSFQEAANLVCGILRDSVEKDKKRNKSE